MKKYLFIAIFLTLCSFSFALADDIQFRLVLLPNEIQEASYDKYQDPQIEDKELFVSKEVLFSNSDIEKISIFKSPLFNDVRATVHFNSVAKEKLLDVTTKYLKRQLAVVVGDKLVTAPKLMEPLLSGEAQIVGPGLNTLKDIEDFIMRTGFAPYLEGKIKSKAEEEDSYRYAKYAMEQNNQDIAGHIIVQLYEYNPESELMQKLLVEYPTLKDAIPKKEQKP